MQKLKSQKFDNLSESVLKILTQNRIITILDFLQEDVAKLTTLTKLNLPDILAIRNDIFVKYSAPLLNGKSLLSRALKTRRQISTGIKSLDSATNGGIPVGYITEICGLAESGKTQLTLQLAINCIKNTDSTVLYVDTKGDFSAIRIQKMLETLDYSNKEMARIMYRIKVVHIWTMEDLVELFKCIKNKALVIDELALIIVDSLPCLMFQYLGDENKMGLSLLNTLVNYSRFIGNEYYLGIIFVNIQTRWIDPDVSEVEDEGEPSSALKENMYLERRNRCLGRYWDHIPTLLLTLEVPEGSKDNTGSTIIKVSVICSNNMKCHKNQCILTLNTSGIG